MTAAYFEVKALHAGYGRAEVLNAVSLRIPQASMVTVVGPNGAGKSTLLNALMGILPHTGRMVFQGRDLSACTLEERVQHGVALVPETRALFNTMSVLDNLLLGSYRLAGVSKGAKQDRADDLKRVYALFPRLQERQQQLAGTLSGGERQMVAIGRALMGRPQLLMLDEPSLGLAPLVMQDIFQQLTALRASGVSILLVEQNARAALAVADYAYVLEGGEITLEGPAADLARDPRVIDAYLGASAAV